MLYDGDYNGYNGYYTAVYFIICQATFVQSSFFMKNAKIYSRFMWNFTSSVGVLSLLVSIIKIVFKSSVKHNS